MFFHLEKLLRKAVCGIPKKNTSRDGAFFGYSAGATWKYPFRGIRRDLSTKSGSKLIRSGARRDDDFAPSEPACVNGECARSQEDEGDRDRNREEAGNPG